MSSVSRRVTRHAVRARAAEDTHALQSATAHIQILVRHGRMPSSACSHCSWPWPCPDVISIAAVYGIEPHDIDP